MVGSLDARLNERVLIIFNGLYFQSSLTDDARVSRRRNLLFVLFSKFPSFFLIHYARALRRRTTSRDSTISTTRDKCKTLYASRSSSSSSGNGCAAASASSFSYAATSARSTWTVGGASAGDSVNCNAALPLNLRARYKKGFSKL